MDTLARSFPPTVTDRWEEQDEKDLPRVHEVVRRQRNATTRDLITAAAFAALTVATVLALL